MTGAALAANGQVFAFKVAVSIELRSAQHELHQHRESSDLSDFSRDRQPRHFLSIFAIELPISFHVLGSVTEPKSLKKIPLGRSEFGNFSDAVVIPATHDGKQGQALPSPQQLSAIIASKQVSMVEVHAKGPWSVLPAPFGSIPRLQNTVPVLVFLYFRAEGFSPQADGTFNV